MTTYGQLYGSFLKIGMFTLGGGYAMIPLMEREVVDKRQWLSQQEFMDTMAIAQSMPGIFAVNMATHVGFRQRGALGAVCAVLGNIAVPIGIIVILAMFFRSFADNRVVESIFKGIRPAVVALIAAPVFNMARTAGVKWQNAWIPIAAALLVWLWGVSPIAIIALAVIGGIIFARIKTINNK